MNLKASFLLFLSTFIVFVSIYAQSPSSGCGGGGTGSGPGSSGPGSGGDCLGCGGNPGLPGGPGGPGGPGSPGIPIFIPTLHATDPNEILGPQGVTTKKWMAGKDKFGYIVRYENDPEFANGPAQKVLISVPIDSNFDINSLRVGSFGFGNLIFNVPPNSPTYYTRLDLRDSLGLYIDVLAGINITSHEAIWVFESIDPATGVEPVNPLLGFLPVRDTSINRFNDSIPNKGEGFVTFTIQPKSTAHTGDTVHAQAGIIFDLNAPVLTNIESNIIDPVAPDSKITNAIISRDSVIVSWTGQDASGSGVRDYALYVSENNQPYSLYKDKIAGTTIGVTGGIGSTYKFFTQATDQVGNIEKLKDTAEVVVQVTKCPVEICNGIDDDCDSLVDEGFTFMYHPDLDGDGFGAVTGGVLATTCNHPANYVKDSTDCDDNDKNTYPGAPEICDGKDNNCNGVVDEGIAKPTWFRDVDGDSYGNPADSLKACTQPAGYVTNKTDCNDNDALVHPGATEICNGKDDNCDGVIDEGCNLITYYRDSDGDGYGNADSTTKAGNQPPAGYVAQSGDCNDHNATIHPGAIDVCNGIDDNCNGQIDEEGCNPRLWYRDGDGDGYGVDNKFKVAITKPAGYSAEGGDCNDANPNIHPGATELPNGIDDNCTGGVDEGLPVYTYYRDADGDGYGNEDKWKESTGPAPVGYVLKGGDCNDNNAAIHPGVTELPNGKDDNCDGQIDEGLTVYTYFRDVDGDGYGNEDKWKESTGPAPAGYVLKGGDCNDNNAAIHPGAAELPNGKDDNCDGQIDEGLPVYTYFRDADGDGYGNENKWKESTGPAPAGYVITGGDCNDNNAAIHPGAMEIPNNKKDDNCDGQVDEVLITATNARSNTTELQESNDSVAVFNINVMPVPSNNLFNIILQGSNKTEKVTLKIYDHIGRLMEVHSELTVGQRLTVGKTYANGFYIVEALQGKNRISVIIVKI